MFKNTVKLEHTNSGHYCIDLRGDKHTVKQGKQHVSIKDTVEEVTLWMKLMSQNV